MRHRKPVLLSAIVAAIAALATPITAFAEIYEDTVKGVEIYASSTRGIFTGTATGHLPGSWTADVMHTPLGGNPQAAVINGGTISLATTLDENSTLITGAFVGGTVVQKTGGGCNNETFEVKGILGRVGPAGEAHDGNGTFNAILTHYRVRIWTSCLTYGASIAGTVSLTF